MQYEGTVYRPPSEAHSLIVQATVGCAHNRCTFCNMYKDKTFRVRPVQQILADLEWARRHYGPGILRIFLADGDALVLPASQLLAILRAAARLFPALQRVAAYGTARDVLAKSEEELQSLAAAGLGLVYLGAESGDDETLHAVHKEVTAAQLAAAGQKLKRCGIHTSVTLISGLGGAPRLEQHALGCARLISAMRPEYASFLTLRLYQGTPLYSDVAAGRFERIGPQGIVTELELFLQSVDSPGTVFRTNHASNYVVLAGTLNGDIPAMLAALADARRSGAYRRWRETGDLL